MPTKKVFYSFHFDNDVMRVQLIRNIGSLEENKPVNPNDWEEVKRGGDIAIRNWINASMNNKECVIVLIGEQTASRKWVKYEIEKAWSEGKGVLGIYIHNLSCANKYKTTGDGRCAQGNNPFYQFTVYNGQRLSSIVPCHNPSALDAYGDISRNLEAWVNNAISIRKKYS